MSAVMHADERNRAMSEALGEDVYHYHLHVVYIPVVEKEIRWTKRCKDKSLVGKVKETVMQVSMSKKWASQPAVDEATGEPLRTAKGKPVLRKSYSVLQDDFFQQMRSAGYTDLERGERGSSEEHLTVTQFKVECEQERLAQLQEAAVLAQAEVDRRNREAAAAEKEAAQAKAKLNDVAHMLKGMEKLAEEFSSDPEQVLPEAGPLESARAYREKKAKPLWAKIVKVLRSVYRAYCDLKSKFERLQADYGREVSKNSSLSERIYEVCAERDSLKGKVRDYERVRRAIGLATLMWTVPGGAQETGGPYMRDPRHPRHFTDEFKRQIVDLYNAGKPKREIMDEYDLGKSTVERWIKSINATGSPRAACNRTPEQNRILELERENRRLRMEVDVLKQAALIYARK